MVFGESKAMKPIKPVGPAAVTIMNERVQNTGVAKATLNICKNKEYTSPSGKIVNISDSLDSARNNTVYYPTEAKIEVKTTYRFPTIEVTNETTAQAAERILASNKQDIVALNFASARNQGGGFLAGAFAQEEDLCRCSGLYPCLKTKPLFYNANILSDSALYTDGIIYSPKVPFFRDKELNLLEEPYELSIVTAPAPNLKGVQEIDLSLTKDKLSTIITNRATKVLQVAASHGHTNIILGAWGCGAFGNDPVMVAEAFRAALTRVPVFSQICFAVYDTRTPPVLFDTFKEVFK